MVPLLGAVLEPEECGRDTHYGSLLTSCRCSCQKEPGRTVFRGQVRFRRGKWSVSAVILQADAKMSQGTAGQKNVYPVRRKSCRTHPQGILRTQEGVEVTYTRTRKEDSRWENLLDLKFPSDPLLECATIFSLEKKCLWNLVRSKMYPRCWHLSDRQEDREFRVIFSYTVSSSIVSATEDLVSK